MNITIEVCPKKAGEDFSFADLELLHRECGRGALAKEHDKDHDWWSFKCKRCGAKGTIFVDECGTIGLIQTAIDGKPRHVSLDSDPNHFQAVQKKE